MRTILGWFDYHDFGSVFVTMFLLTLVARVMDCQCLRVLRWSYRLAGAAMFAHATLLWLDWAPQTASTIAGIIFRCLITGALILSASKIVLTGISSLYAFTMKLWIASLKRTRAQQQAEAQRLREAAAEAERRRAAQLKWEREAPAREQARIEAERQAWRARLAQQSREQARLYCELCYAYHAPEIQTRFPPGDFKRFVKRYMRDDLPPAEVQTAGEELQRIIRDHAAKKEPPPQFRSISDISDWLKQHTVEAEKIPDDRLRCFVLAQLKRRYTDLTVNLLGLQQ